MKEIIMTYSEEDRQENLQNKENKKSLFSPEFIPMYLEEMQEYNLTHLETLVYGFIRFYKINKLGEERRFWFESEDLAHILNSTKGSIDNVISRLKTAGLIDCSRKTKKGGGTIRFINEVRTHSQMRLVDLTHRLGTSNSPTSELHIKENNIKENNIPLVFKKSQSNAQELAGGGSSQHDRTKSTSSGGKQKVADSDSEKEIYKMSNSDFEDFYKSYPRKKGKEAGRKKFFKLDNSLLPKMYKSLEQFKGIDPQFIPHFSTYINQKRWEDEEDVKTYKTLYDEFLDIGGCYFERKYGLEKRAEMELMQYS